MLRAGCLDFLALPVIFKCVSPSIFSQNSLFRVLLSSGYNETAMQDLQNKVALVTGVANKRSIAFAIAKKLKEYGVQLVLTYLPLDKDNIDQKLMKLMEELKPDLMLPLDAGDETSVKAVMAEVEQRFGKLHVLVHSIASAKRDELSGRHLDISWEGFALAQQISSYTLISLTRAAHPLLVKEGGSVITLTYIGAERACPNYNVMGAAKASLEANVRYLAMDLGPENIRVNGLSAGPIRTLSASGIKNFLDLLHNAEEHSPLKRNVELEEVANTAAFLSSQMSSGITGQTIYVDGGYNIYG